MTVIFFSGSIETRKQITNCNAKQNAETKPIVKRHKCDHQDKTNSILNEMKTCLYYMLFSRNFPRIFISRKLTEIFEN